MLHAFVGIWTYYGFHIYQWLYASCHRVGREHMFCILTLMYIKYVHVYTHTNISIYIERKRYHHICVYIFIHARRGEDKTNNDNKQHTLCCTTANIINTCIIMCVCICVYIYIYNTRCVAPQLTLAIHVSSCVCIYIHIYIYICIHNESCTI